MTLFNSTGLEIGDKVFVVLSNVKYFGKVIKIDEKWDKISVNYTSPNGHGRVYEWFNKSFWEKVI